jgi:hypothetical protein
MLASLAVKATTTEVGETVRSLRISSEAVRNARAQRLRTEFESIRFKKGETVDDFTMRLGSLVVELGTLGDVIKEQQVVQKLLRVIPKHLSQVAVTIEVTQDLSNLTLEDAGGKLRAAEDHTMEDDALPPPRVDDKLLLMEEQWKEKMRQCSNAGQRSSGAASSADAYVSVTTTGRRECSVTTSVITAGALAIGTEIAASQGRSG